MRPRLAGGAAMAFSLMAIGAARAESLADAVALAYRTNPTLGSSRYDLRAADENVVQARAEFRPTADLQVTGGYNRSIEGRTSREADPFSPEASDINNDQAQLVLSQPIYTGGRASADRAVAEASIREQRDVLRSAEGDMLLAVITAYVDVRRYAATLEVWKQSVDDLTKLTKEIEARQVAGELTHTDIAQAQAQLDMAREQVEAAAESLEGARADYAALVGHDPGMLDPEPALPQLPPTIENAYDRAERQNPELAQALDTELGSRDEISAVRAQGRPTVSLRGTATLSGPVYPLRLRDQDQGYAGSIVISLPLSAGGHTASQIRQAEDKNSSDRFKIEAERRAVDHNVRTAWNQAVVAEREVRLLDHQREQAAIQLDGMINEYRVGLRSTFDLLYAEQQLRDTQVSQLSSNRDHYVGQATLLRQAGLLEVQALVTGVPLYDFAAHLRTVEHKNSLPWDVIVAAFDKLGEPRPHQHMLQQTQRAPGQPVIVKLARAFPEDAPLATTMPTNPLPETIGQPAMLSGKLH